MKIVDFLTKIEDILEVDSGEINIETNLCEYEEWDSLSMMSVMALFNKEFGIALKIQDVKDVKTVKDLIALAQDYIN